MNRYIVAAGVVALVTVPAIALQAGDRDRPAPPGLPVTRAEIQAQVRERFAALDLDRNGTITAQEVAAKRMRMQQERVAAEAGARDRDFAMLDTDRNGQLTPQEFAKAPPVPEPGAGIPDGAAPPPPPPAPDGRMADRRGGPDGPGHGLRGPMHDGPEGFGGRGPGERWIAWTDSNEDGKLTLAEALARPLARFDSDDANHDGIVTPTEREQAHSKLRRAWRAVAG
jgi:hypothetical protein